MSFVQEGFTSVFQQNTDGPQAVGCTGLKHHITKDANPELLRINAMGKEEMNPDQETVK